VQFALLRMLCTCCGGSGNAQKNVKWEDADGRHTMSATEGVVGRKTLGGYGDAKVGRLSSAKAVDPPIDPVWGGQLGSVHGMWAKVCACMCNPYGKQRRKGKRQRRGRSTKWGLGEELVCKNRRKRRTN